MARPTRFDEAATIRIMVRVTPSQFRDLKKVAAENQTNTTGVIREAVDEYVSDYRDRLVFRLTKP